MGCCWSDPVKEGAVLQRPQGPAAVHDFCFPDKLGPGGLKVLASSSASDASCGHSYNRLVVGPDWIFAALFEAHGPSSKHSGESTTRGAFCDAAAQFCAERCLDEYLQAHRTLASNSGEGSADLRQVLTETLRGLDQRFLADNAVPLQDRLASGCTAVLLHLSLGPAAPEGSASGRQWSSSGGNRIITATAASLGPCAAVVGQRQGGLASATSAPLVLCGGSAVSYVGLQEFLASLAEEWQQHWPQNSPAVSATTKPSAKASFKAKAQSIGDSFTGKGKSKRTAAASQPPHPAPAASSQGPQYCKDPAAPQAIGFGAAKGLGWEDGSAHGSGKGAQGRHRRVEPRVGFDVQTAQLALGTAVESVVLLSGGAAATLSPWDAAFLMHRMGKLSSIPFKAKPSPLAEPQPGSVAIQLDNLGVAGPPPAKPSAAANASAAEPYGVAPFNAARMLVQHAASGTAARRAQASGLNGVPPAAVLALSLDWEPHVTGDSASAMAAIGASVAAVAAAAAAAAREGRRARYRWQLLRLYYKHPHKHRSVLIDRWHELFDRVVGEANRGARAKEVTAWKRLGAAVQVSAAGNVRNLTASATSAPENVQKATVGASSNSPATSLRSLGGGGATASPTRSTVASAAASRHTTPSRLSAAAAPTRTSPGGSQRTVRSGGGGCNVSGRGGVSGGGANRSLAGALSGGGGGGVTNRNIAGVPPAPAVAAMELKASIAAIANPTSDETDCVELAYDSKEPRNGGDCGASAAAEYVPVVAAVPSSPSEPASAVQVAAASPAPVDTPPTMSNLVETAPVVAVATTTLPDEAAAAVALPPALQAGAAPAMAVAPAPHASAAATPEATPTRSSAAESAHATTATVASAASAMPPGLAPSPRDGAFGTRAGIRYSSNGGSHIPSLSHATGANQSLSVSACSTPTPAKAPLNVQVHTSIPAPPILTSPSPRSPASNLPRPAANLVRSSIPSLQSQSRASGTTPQTASAAKAPVSAEAPAQLPNSARNPLRVSTPGGGIPTPPMATSPIGRQSRNGSAIPSVSAAARSIGSRLPRPSLSGNTTPMTTPQATPLATPAASPFTTKAAAASAGVASASSAVVPAAAAAAAAATSDTAVRTSSTNPTSGVARSLFPRNEAVSETRTSAVVRPPRLSGIPDPAAPYAVRDPSTGSSTAGAGPLTAAAPAGDAVGAGNTAPNAIPSASFNATTSAGAAIAAANAAVSGGGIPEIDMDALDLVSPDASVLAAWASQAVEVIAGASPGEPEPQRSSQGQQPRKPWEEEAPFGVKGDVSASSVVAEMGVDARAKVGADKPSRMPLSPREANDNAPKRSVSVGGQLAAKVAAGVAVGAVSGGGWGTGGVEVSPSMRAASARSRR